MKRLTDPKVAQNLKENLEALKKVGIEPSVMDLRYIKLSEYEDEAERRELFTHADPDSWYE